MNYFHWRIGREEEFITAAGKITLVTSNVSTRKCQAMSLIERRDAL